MAFTKDEKLFLKMKHNNDTNFINSLYKETRINHFKEKRKQKENKMSGRLFKEEFNKLF